MKKLTLTLVLVCTCISLQAQDLPDGTVDVYFQQGSADGKIDSCMLVFTSLVRDFATQRGTQVIINGSIAIRKLGPERLMFSGKLGTRPFHSQNNWQEPAHFFFATANRSTAGHAKIANSDTPDYKLLIAPMNTELIGFLEEVGQSGQFTAGFNRRVGGQDVTAPITLNVALKKDATGNAAKVVNDETAPQFFGCLKKLLH